MGFTYNGLKRYEEAMEQFILVVQKNPSYSNAYFNMGDILRNLKRDEEAIKQYKLAIQYDPSNSNVYNNLGISLGNLNRYEEAIEQYKLAIQHDPSDSTSYNNMGRILRILKRYEEAIEQYKLAIQYDPSDSIAYNNMGVALYELKRYEEAIEKYKLAIEYNDSPNLNYYCNMGMALYELKRYEEAIEQYKLVIQSNPSSLISLNNMGLALCELKRYGEAMEQYKLAIQYDYSNSTAYYNKGKILMIMGRYDEAEEEIKYSLNLLIPSLTSSLLEELNKVFMGWIMIKRRDFQSANQIFSIDLKNKLSTDAGKLIKAILLYKQGDYYPSLSLLYQIKIHDISRNGLLEINYYYYTAMCLWKSMENDIKNGGEKDGEERRRGLIVEWLNKAIEKDKEWVKAYYRRAQLFSLLQSPPSNELISSIKSDLEFVIQINQQIPPVHQLSLSKINFLISSLMNDTKSVLCKRGVIQ